MSALDVIVFYVPVDHTEVVMAALFEAGAGRVGEYDMCAFVAEGRGQFRPQHGADPAIGVVGELEHVAENRVEITFPRVIRALVVLALRQAHPYEEPAFHVLSNEASVDSRCTHEGLGYDPVISQS